MWSWHADRPNHQSSSSSHTPQSATAATTTHSQTLPPKHYPSASANSAHLPQFHTNQNTAHTAFVLHSKSLAHVPKNTNVSLLPIQSASFHVRPSLPPPV